MGQRTHLNGYDIGGYGMSDAVFNICVLMSVMGIMGLVFGIAERVFDFTYENCPSFKAAIDRFIGDEDEVQ